LKIGSTVIDCKGLGKMLGFWQQALGYAPREPAKRGCVVLRDPWGEARTSPSTACRGRPPEGTGGTLTLYTSDREGKVERLLKIGAKRHRQAYNPGDDFRVLEDPDGNLFCVVQKDAV
jgi:hypothetical protein